jgi:hypothetical protein
VLLEGALTPGFKWLSERLVEATDGTGTGGDPHECLGHFSHLLGACPCHEHLRQSFGDMRFIAAVPLKHLRVEVTFPVPGHFEILKPTRRSDQIAGVVAVALAVALGAAFSPSDPDERIELLAHHVLHHHANGAAGQVAQILLERLLIGQR